MRTLPVRHARAHPRRLLQHARAALVGQDAHHGQPPSTPRRRTPLRLTGALVLLALLVGACGGKSNTATQQSTTGPSAAGSTAALATTPPGTAAAGGAATTITVRAQDFSFQLDHQTIPAGRVHVVFINESKDYKHELWIYPNAQPKLDQMLAAKQAGQDVAEEDYLQGLAGHVEDVPPGQTASFDAALQPGTYELGCFITDTIAGKQMVHYQMGMHTLLTVEPTAS
jgi:uncharacterized cupredoxin-like copper-binding protein